jgi:hypothetical protein
MNLYKNLPFKNGKDFLSENFKLQVWRCRPSLLTGVLFLVYVKGETQKLRNSNTLFLKVLYRVTKHTHHPLIRKALMVGNNHDSILSEKV